MKRLTDTGITEPDQKTITTGGLCDIVRKMNIG